VNVYLQDKDDISAFVGRCWSLDWFIYHVFSPITNKIQAHAAAFAAHPKVGVIPGDPQIENSLRGRKLWPIVQNGLYIPLFLITVAFFPLFFLVHAVIRLAKILILAVKNRCKEATPIQ
jgi:hypothetical protein